MIKIIISILLIFFFTSCTNVPPNLSDIKKEIKEYYSSGAFEDEVEDIAEEAISQLEKISLNDKSAAIFDVDETALLNWDYVESMDFGYSRESWESWLLESRSNPIKGVKRIYDWLIKRDVNIIFLTGRTEESYEATYMNLKSVGYSVFDTLITRSLSETKTPVAEYKISKRRAIRDSGLDIILCIGDQPEDLFGDFTGLRVKIPNYLYKLSNP